MEIEDPTPLTGDDVETPVEPGILDEVKPQEPESVDEGEQAKTEDDSENPEEITIEDLAAYAGLESDRLDVNDDGQVLVKVKVDGQESSVPFQEVIANYQQVKHLSKETKETVELKKELKAQQAQAKATLDAELQKAQDLIQLAYQDLTSDYQSVNWTELEQDEPDRFAAMKIKFRDRQDNLVQRYNALVEERRKNQPDLTQSRKEVGAKLVEAIPEWKDTNVAKKELEEIHTYAFQHGYTEEGIASIVNHEDYLLLRKAMLYDRLQEEKPSVEKVVRKVRKLAKPGATKPKAQPKTAEQILYGT